MTSDSEAIWCLVPAAKIHTPSTLVPIRAIGKHYVPDKYFKCAYAKVAFVPMRKENIATEGSNAMH
jgi:hypothetical protein